MQRSSTNTAIGEEILAVAPPLHCPIRGTQPPPPPDGKPRGGPLLTVAPQQQELVRHARRIAASYPPPYRAQYQQAADRLRAPFWDWASDQAVPPATVPARVRVNVPSGQALRTAEIDNPLATYRFPRAAINGQFGDWDSQRRPQIYHCPSPYTFPDSADSNLRSRPYKQWAVRSAQRGRERRVELAVC